jgi:hypothetical protein
MPARIKLWWLSSGILLALLLASTSVAQVNVGRFQLVSVSAGQQAGVFLLDTISGCTWQLARNDKSKRMTFVEMDVENLHWSWGSGAQGEIVKKIDSSKLDKGKKSVLKKELRKTACGWTPVVVTPPKRP